MWCRARCTSWWPPRAPPAQPRPLPKTGAVSPELPSVVLRAASFIALLQATGMALFLSLFGGLRAPAATAATARAVRRVAVAAAVLLVGQCLVEAGRWTGEMAGIMDLSMQRRLLAGSNGAVLALRLAGIAASLRAVAAGAERRIPYALGGVLLAAGSFALIGHTAVGPLRALLGPMVAAHVGIAAFWFGALPPLLLALRLDGPAAAGELARRFSRVAIVAVPLLPAAGIVLAVGLVPNWQTFAQPYGRLLMVKLGGFALLMGLAALNKRRWAPAAADGDGRASRRFAGSLVAEFVTICAVLSVTAVLTAFYSPEGE